MDYFNRPTQVVFVDNELIWAAGIAYKDEIICACCGGVFPIDEVQEYGKEKGVKEAIHSLEWVDLTKEITWDSLEDFVAYKGWE